MEVPLHPTVIQILGERKQGLVFKLPTADGANKVLKQWCEFAKIGKHITWHCARLGFSVLLRIQKTDPVRQSQVNQSRPKAGTKCLAKTGFGQQDNLGWFHCVNPQVRPA